LLPTITPVKSSEAFLNFDFIIIVICEFFILFNF
jgi:hypothetical protein